MTIAPSEEVGQTADDGLRSVLGKCFAILDAVTANGELSLSEISRATGVSKSTAYRLTKRLGEWGALQEQSGKYCIGIRIFEMGRSVSTLKRLRELALPYIEDLYEVTHQVVHLGIRVGSEVMYVEKISGHRSVAVPTSVGGRMPLHCTALGKALLAFSDEKLTMQTIRAGLTPRTPYTIASGPLLGEELQKIRERGIALEREESVIGISCVASPVLAADQRAIAALSMTMPSHKFHPERLGPAVRTAALALSRAVATAGMRTAVPAGVNEPQ